MRYKKKEIEKKDLFSKIIGASLAFISTVVSLIFAISLDVPMPILEHENGTEYESPHKVTIGSMDDLKIYYTVCRIEPELCDTENILTYTKPIILTESTIIIAQTKFWFMWSPIRKESYNIYNPSVPFIEPTSIEVDDKNLGLIVADQHRLQATILPEDAFNPIIEWYSSDEDIAIVNDGVIHAKAIGKTVIFAKTAIYDLATSCEIEVKEPPRVPPTGVRLNITSSMLEIGGSVKLRATVDPDNTTNKSVSWASSNASVATVSSNGNVTAIGPGSAIITVRTGEGGFSASCSITVN